MSYNNRVKRQLDIMEALVERNREGSVDRLGDSLRLMRRSGNARALARVASESKAVLVVSDEAARTEAQGEAVEARVVTVADLPACLRGEFRPLMLDNTVVADALADTRLMAQGLEGLLEFVQLYLQYRAECRAWEEKLDRKLAHILVTRKATP